MTTVQTVTAYTFFGVAPDCSQATLRQAYDAAVARHRPDTAWSTPTAAASKTGMQEVNRWWALIATEEARAAYDLMLQKKKPKKTTTTTSDTLLNSPAKMTNKQQQKTRHNGKGSGSRQTRQLVLARPPLLRPVALFCDVVVSLAQAVAVVGGWLCWPGAAAWRRKRGLLRLVSLLAVFLITASLLAGWPVNGTRWMSSRSSRLCALPPPPLAANRHYLQLGLDSGDATTPFADIRKAYHQAIKVHHPDKQTLLQMLQRKQQQKTKTKSKLDALALLLRDLGQRLPLCNHSKRLQAISEAYAVLRNPHTRCAYDVQQQQRKRLWLRSPTTRQCSHARWEYVVNEAPVVSPVVATTKNAVVLVRSGQVAVFQTVQSLWRSVWASVRGLARRMIRMIR